MKAGGANRIRYPGSPSRKRCKLDDPIAVRDRSVAGKPLSLPPGEYGRKAESTRRKIISTFSSSLKGISGGTNQTAKRERALEGKDEDLARGTASLKIEVR